jgi:glutamate synthase (NADPH) small chain
MGEFFSRICTDPCEPACVVGAPGEEVAINAVERFLQHYAATQGHHQSVRPTPNGFKVAVLDAGPCGLACAHDLASSGFAVTVLDHHLLPGGLLVNGLPAFKVERTVVEQQKRHLETLGVQFRLGVKLGRDVSLRELLDSFDAVFLGDCAEEAVPLAIPGANLRGVYQGLTFLIQKNAPVALDLEPIEVKGRRVVVLGAGDTAMDCLRTAMRSGASEALCIFRRDVDSLPADPHEYRNAVEEGARFEFMVTPVALIGDASNQVTRVRCARTRLIGSTSSKESEVEAIPGSEFDLPADMVLVAFGYSAGTVSRAGDFAQIAVDKAGRIKVDANLMTSVPKVFAGGTLVRGRIPVVETVRDARQAARSIRQRLVARH